MLEVEIESNKYATGPDVLAERTCGLRFGDGVFGVEGETGTAVHDRVVARAEGISVEIAEIAGVRGESLPRNAHDFIAIQEYPLRAHGVMGFDKAAIPSGRLSANWQGHIAGRDGA